ncbi:MAG: hypothetical protein ABIA12_01410 [Candidatus Aenigmatarchaeota archaeon]
MTFDALAALLAVVEYAQKNRGKAAAALVAFVALIAMAAGMLGQFVFVMFVLAELGLAFFLGEWQLRKVGIELVTFVTVLAGFLYGPSAGLMMGGVLVALHFVLARNLGAHLVYCIPTMSLIGFLAGYGHEWPFGVALLGVSLSGLYNVITGAVGTVMFGDFFQELVWSGSNFALNYVMFTAVAPAVVAAVA